MMLLRDLFTKGLFRSSQGHLFLVCSCFTYQQTLHLCECMFLVKHMQLDVLADVSPHYHLSYAMNCLPTECEPAFGDGLVNEPGVLGVPVEELRQAVLMITARAQ